MNDLICLAGGRSSCLPRVDTVFRTILKREYLFHLHTTFTDGTSTVAGYCAYAYVHGYRVLVFTEHVRKELAYDWLDYLEAIGRARMVWPGLEIWCGCEAKVLPGGGLDMPDNLPGLEVLCIAVHSFDACLASYIYALTAVFAADEWRDCVRVWVHPGRWLKKQGYDDGVLETLVSFATRHDVLIEYDKALVKMVPREFRVRGFDAHSVEDLLDG